MGFFGPHLQKSLILEVLVLLRVVSEDVSLYSGYAFKFYCSFLITC